MIVCDTEILGCGRFVGLHRLRFRLLYRLLRGNGLNDNIIGQAVLHGGIDRRGRGGRRFLALRLRRGLLRLLFFWLEQVRVALVVPDGVFKIFAVDDLVVPRIGAGVDPHVNVTDIADGAGNVAVRVRHDNGISHLVDGCARQVDRLDDLRVMVKSVALLLELGTEDSRGLGPRKVAFGAVFVLDIDFDAGRRGIIVQRLAGLHGHSVGASGVGFGEALRDFGVALTGANPAHDQLLVTVFQQSAVPGERVLQIAVRIVQIGGKVFGDWAVAGVPVQHGLKIPSIF